MAVLPIARMLLELGDPIDAAPTKLKDMAVPACQGKCFSEEEVRSRIEDARARGVAEGMELSRSEMLRSEQLLRKSLADEHRDQLARLSTEVIQKVDKAVTLFRAEASSALSQSLIAYFRGRLELDAMEALTSEIAQVIKENGAALIRIRGPQLWIDRLSGLPEIARTECKVDLQADDTVDVTVTIDGTLLETTVGNWLAGLERIS